MKINQITIWHSVDLVPRTFCISSSSFTIEFKPDTLSFLITYLQLSLNDIGFLERRGNRLSLNFSGCCSRHVTREINLWS